MRTVCMLLALAAGAAGQGIHQAEVARARNLLASADWREKAWGAYLAGNLRSEELQEPLAGALREAAALRDSNWASEEHSYVATLFDAAIQSGTILPGEVLEPFENNWLQPVIVLMARDTSNEEALLRLRARQMPDNEWLAVDNLLLARKSQAFFAKTLGEVNFWHTFTLVDPGDRNGQGGSGGSGACGDGVLTSPKGFPPFGLYLLLSSPRPGDVLLATGPRNTYYRRVVVSADHPVGFGSCDSPLDRQELRTGYLMEMSGEAERQATWIFDPETRIEYRDEAGVRAEWEAALSAQESAIRRLVESAARNGWSGVAGMHLEIILKVEDLRKTSQGPTPAVTPREFVLE